MENLIDAIISYSLSTIIYGRLISDNILIATEVGHYLRRKHDGKDGWDALKLDMVKAYDKMEWIFVANDVGVWLHLLIGGPYNALSIYSLIHYPSKWRVSQGCPPYRN